MSGLTEGDETGSKAALLGDDSGARGDPLRLWAAGRGREGQGRRPPRTYHDDVLVVPAVSSLCPEGLLGGQEENRTRHMVSKMEHRYLKATWFKAALASWTEDGCHFS